MFAMLKVKHSADEYISLMKDEIGGQVSSEEENVGFVAAHFQNLLNEKGLDKEEQERAINLVEKCRSKSISPHHSQWLDLDITADELSNAINQLKSKKSPGKDGLPAEFFSTFKECIIHPLLEIWREAVGFNALPLPINEGIIKLIHKKDEKDIISN